MSYICAGDPKQTGKQFHVGGPCPGEAQFREAGFRARHPLPA